MLSENQNNSPVLRIFEWQEKVRRYREQVYPYTSDFRERRGRRKPDPIYDFLFTYYPYSTRKLEVWHPGFGTILEIGDDAVSLRYRKDPSYRLGQDGLELNPQAIRPAQIRQLEWIGSLSRAIAGRQPRLSCFGLHEWAMVYRSNEIRHAAPLRLSSAQIAQTVESMPICCSHYDAFRFFAPEAVRLNVIQPRDDSRIELEQGGCIHANMDLYKWAFKLSPLISSDLLGACFFLAVEAREIDMRASPYDFSSQGYAPIKIETEDGRREYRLAQQSIAQRAAELRLKLIEKVDQLLGADFISECLREKTNKRSEFTPGNTESTA